MLSKEGDLVPTDLEPSKVVPSKRMLHKGGDLIPIAKVLRNVKGDLLHIIMLLIKIYPAAAFYQSG